MKHREHGKPTEARKAERSPISRDVPSPFFPKQFAGFVYVKKRRSEPERGEIRDDAEKDPHLYYGTGAEHLETHNT